MAEPPFSLIAGDRGAVTVEAALALCSLVLVLVLAIGMVSATGAQLRCMDAAREMARLVARGEPDRARRVGGLIAPADAQMEIRVMGDEATVEVSSRVLGLPLDMSVSARAISVLEPGVLVDGSLNAVGSSEIGPP